MRSVYGGCATVAEIDAGRLEYGMYDTGSGKNEITTQATPGVQMTNKARHAASSKQ